jgi:hypothetical protein
LVIIRAIFVLIYWISWHFPTTPKPRSILILALFQTATTIIVALLLVVSNALLGTLAAEMAGMVRALTFETTTMTG